MKALIIAETREAYDIVKPIIAAAWGEVKEFSEPLAVTLFSPDTLFKSLGGDAAFLSSCVVTAYANGSYTYLRNKYGPTGIVYNLPHPTPGTLVDGDYTVQFMGDLMTIRRIIKLSWGYGAEHTYFHIIPNTGHAILQFPISVFGERYDEFVSNATRFEQNLTVTTHPKVYIIS